MTMLIHQFNHGSLRRKSNMLAKVLLITFIAVASCQEHGYSLKTHHEPTRQHYEHQPIRVQEEHEAEQQPQYTNSEGHGQAYSSQSVIYNAGGHGGGYASQNEHVAPVYQYSSEEEGQNNQEQPTHYETPVHQKIPATRYQTIHLTPALSHNEIQAHPQIDEHQTQYFQAHEAVGYQQDSEQNAAPIQHVDPVHRVRPVQYSAPAYHAVSEHHAASIPHATLDNHISSVHHANAIPVQHAEVHAQDSHEEPVDYYAYPKYQYEYKVEDPHTGDNKFQHEFRDGDVVKGIYGLHEADGSIRVVEYSSDKHNGFNAVVKHMAPGQHVQIKTHHQN